MADREIAKAPTAGMLKLKIYVEAFGFEDLDAAQAASNRLTAADLMDDEIVAEAVRVAMLRRDADEILRLMKVFPGEKIDSVIDVDAFNRELDAEEKDAAFLEGVREACRKSLKGIEGIE